MKIKHIAIKVDDMDKAADFYMNTLGLEHVSTIHKEGAKGARTSKHLTDGYLDITLIQYASDASEGYSWAGDGPCIHHIGIEVEDVDGMTKKIKEGGAEIMSDEGRIPVKFRSPAGPLAEIVPEGRFDQGNLKARDEKVEAA